jgi:hypothetical protein
MRQGALKDMKYVITLTMDSYEDAARVKRVVAHVFGPGSPEWDSPQPKVEIKYDTPDQPRYPEL